MQPFAVAEIAIICYGGDGSSPRNRPPDRNFIQSKKLSGNIDGGYLQKPGMYDIEHHGGTVLPHAGVDILDHQMKSQEWKSYGQNP